MAVVLALTSALANAQPGINAATSEPRIKADSASTVAGPDAGRRLYNARCYFCHGYAGDARTVASDFLLPKPLDFTSAPAAQLSRERLIASIRDGRPGTAMKPFGSILNPQEITLVADFIVTAFVRRALPNTQYHTVANGWPNHERYRHAFPFARGETALDTPAEVLSPQAQRGRELFLNACVSCHQARHLDEAQPTWQIRPVTWPLDYYLLAEYGNAPHDERFDPHHRHEHPRTDIALDLVEQDGERLYQDNCVSCHAADGSGRSWRGSFLEPPLPALDAALLEKRSPADLADGILDARPGSAMPSWRNVLSRPEVESIVAYLYKVMAAPAVSPARR